MSSSTSSSSPLGAALDATPVAPWATRRYVRRALLWPTAAVLLAELLCRVVSPVYLENPDPREVEVAAPGYRRLRPNLTTHTNVGGVPTTVKVNADGFRDAPFPATRACLVVGVGNSFVANWALPQEAFWSTQLESKLGNGPDVQRCAVRSAGFQGWTLAEMDSALAHVILPQRPEVVVLFFSNLTMWTDAAFDPAVNDAAIAKWQASSGHPPRPPPRSEATWMGRVIGFYNTIERHSALLGTLKVRAPMLPMTLGLSELAVAPVYRDEVFSAREGPTLASLDLLRGRIERAGAKLLVVAVPARPEADEDVYALMLAAYGGSDRGVNLTRPVAAVQKWAQARHVPFLDLAPVLRGRQPPAMGYVDHHWNDVGNALAAKELEPLVRQLLPPTTR